MTSQPDLYRRHRFPSQIISHFVWLYFRFSLSYSDVELLMTQKWRKKFGQQFAKANQIARASDAKV